MLYRWSCVMYEIGWSHVSMSLWPSSHVVYIVTTIFEAAVKAGSQR